MNEPIHSNHTTQSAPLPPERWLAYRSDPESSATADGAPAPSLLDEESVDDLVAEFQMYGKVAAEPQVRRFMAIARAKGKGAAVFKDFCERVGLNPSSSTTRKYLKIGIEGDWLLLIAKHLPSEWTTIYDVALLGEAKARELIRRGVLHRQAIAKELAATGDVPVESDNAAAIEFTLKVRVTGLAEEEALAAYNALAKAASDHGLAITGLPDRLSERNIIEREAV